MKGGNEMKKTLQIEVEFESWFDKDREPKTNDDWVGIFAEHFISASSVIGDDDGLFQDMISIKGCNIEIIDPVVSALEKPLPTDEQMKERGNLTCRVMLRQLNCLYERNNVTMSVKELQHWFETGQHLKEWKEWNTL